MNFNSLSREELINILNTNETIVNAVPIGFCITNEDGIYEKVNSHYCKIYGYSREELIGQHFSMVTTDQNREELTRLHDKFIKEGCELNSEWTVKNKSGEKITIAANAARVKGTDGRCKKVTYVIDITENKKQEAELLRINKELERRALIDELTGLYNYGEIMQQLIKEINRSKHTGANLTIMMLDIDDFTNVNNTYGHVVGDQLLAELGRIIKANIRKMDSAGRHGGDEFLIIFSNTDLETAKIAAERILNSIRKINIEDAEITFSAGLYQFNGEKADDLVAKADKLLYQAKNADKNKIEYPKKL
jgi:diguanylate cyclase (GGDEF)-like protein/PAS domain S-box-containing protein